MSFHLCLLDFFFFFFKQKTAYELRISDWSSDVCSSDLLSLGGACRHVPRAAFDARAQTSHPCRDTRCLCAAPVIHDASAVEGGAPRRSDPDIPASSHSPFRGYCLPRDRESVV